MDSTEFKLQPLSCPPCSLNLEHLLPCSEITSKTRAKLSGEVDINDVYAVPDEEPDLEQLAGEEAPQDVDELLKDEKEEILQAA